MFGGLKNWFVKTTNDWTPADIPKESVFKKDGRLTPLEFTQAGDRLILASKMWQWQTSTPKGKLEATLDPKKQFLKATTISKSRMQDEQNEISKTCFVEDFLIVGNAEQKKPEDFQEPVSVVDNSVPKKIRDFNDDESDEEISKEKDDNKQNKLVDEQRRTYEVHITYDRHYLTPRFWLSGVDYKNTPLTKEQIMKEVMNE